MASEEDTPSTLTCKGTPVSELRVIDIKRELDQRGLSKSGSKTQLTERLKAQLLLEKLQQDAAQSSGDELEGKAPNMALQDDKTGQNDFVRQYLQQQQRNIEIQMEVKKQVEEERKRKSADESSTDESIQKEDSTPTPAEPEMTSPKKFKDEQPNAPVKGGAKMPRIARKSSRNVSKGENGREDKGIKDNSRSSTPENESIRERTRSGSSSSDRSPPPEKSRRGRKTRAPRGRPARGARRGGRSKESRSSSPSSSPEVIPKRKRRSTNSVSSRSRSRSPPMPSEVGTRRSSRRAAANVRTSYDEAPDVEAEDEKQSTPQRRRGARRSQVLDSQVDAPMETSPSQVSDTGGPQEKGDNSEKQTKVKIAEDHSGQKINPTAADDDTAAQGKGENGEETRQTEKIEKVNPEKQASSPPKVEEIAEAQTESSKPENCQKTSEAGKPPDIEANDKKPEQDPKPDPPAVSQEPKSSGGRLSRWRSSRTKSHNTPPQMEEAAKNDREQVPAGAKLDEDKQDQNSGSGDVEETVMESTKEEGKLPLKPDVEVFKDAQRTSDPVDQQESDRNLSDGKPAHKPDESSAGERKVAEEPSSKKDDGKVSSRKDCDKVSSEKDSGNYEYRPVGKSVRGRRKNRSRSGSSSSSRSSSSDSKSDQSDSSDSSRSRSRSSSSSSSSDEEEEKPRASKRDLHSRKPPSEKPMKVDAVTPKEKKDDEKIKDKHTSQPLSTREPEFQPKALQKATLLEVVEKDEQNDSQANSATAAASGTKESPRDVSECDDNAKKEKMAKKRKWGSKTSKAVKVVKKPANMEISSDSLKGLIGEVKLTETVFDMETEVVNTLDYDEQEDDRRDIKVKRTVVQSSPRPEQMEVDEAVEEEGDARQVEAREDDEEEEIEGPVEKPHSPESIPEEPQEKKIIKVVSTTPMKEKETKKKVKEGKKVKAKKAAAAEKEKEKELVEKPAAVKEKIIATHRPSKPLIQQVDDPEPMLEKQPAARFPASNVVRIIGLVRPFTLNQLKELLRRTGELDEELFWINNIKSECLATYKTQEEAVATRKALHGTKWPSSNPKILDVDFSCVEDVRFLKDGNRGPLPSTQKAREAPPMRAPNRREEEERERRRAREQREKEREERDKESRDRRDAEKLKRRDAERRPAIREWDRDKIQQMSRSRSRSKGREDERSRRSRDRDTRDRDRERSDRKRRDRSHDKDEEKKKEKKPKAEEEPPAKLLDDLFRKTKATPCIYWLPLTEEQAQLRLVQREEREKERQKRLAAIEERNREEQKKREAARLERQKERQRERSRERVRDRGRSREGGGRSRNRGRSSGSRSRSRSRSRRRR